MAEPATYVRMLDDQLMIEIAPHQFVSKKALIKLGFMAPDPEPEPKKGKGDANQYA